MELFVRYIGISCFWTTVLVGLFIFSPTSTLEMSFWGWLTFYLTGVPISGTGAYLGRLFRDFTAPDMFLSSGAADTFKQKLFWSIGPQTIGWGVGIYGAFMLVVYWFFV